MNYKTYLLSDEWKLKRQIIIERDGGRCRCCNSTKNINVHHRTYETIHTAQEINDLTLLCEKCHKAIHKESNIVQGNIIHKVDKKENKKYISKFFDTEKDYKTETSKFWILSKNNFEVKINKSIWKNTEEFIETFIYINNNNITKYKDLNIRLKKNKWHSIKGISTNIIRIKQVLSVINNPYE